MSKKILIADDEQNIVISIEFLLRREGFEVLVAGDGEEEAFRWLVDHGHRELAMVGNKMHQVKRKMDEDYGDYHRLSQD